MILQVGVKILLQNGEGEYLLVRRSGDKYGFSSWDIPGGRIDTGSALLLNLKREIAEEVGLEINDDVKLIAAQDIFTKDGEKHVVRLTYIGRALTEKIVLDTTENTEFIWCSHDELKAKENLDEYLSEIVHSSDF
jgi:ADP-ribose pyrophosphatase YjhB (NUDIX family)